MTDATDTAIKGILKVRVDRCIGCKRCTIECAVAHSATQDLLEAPREQPRPSPRLAVRAKGEKGTPVVCRHCGKAPCLEACPAGAIQRLESGYVVVIDEELCTGCESCVEACPFGVIRMAPGGDKAVKCDLCIDRQHRGLEPACVAACHVHALEWESLADVAADKTAVTYAIDPEACRACGRCLKACPVHAITGAKKTPHVIDADACIRCGLCLEVCPFDAVRRS